MTWAYYASIVVSATLFLFYGSACLFFEGMRRDFERFGLSRFRILVGTLEVLGAFGLVVGQLWPPLVALSAGGLALMMFVGIATRLRALDSLAQTLPALVLMCVNLFIAWVALGPLGAATLHREYGRTDCQCAGGGIALASNRSGRTKPYPPSSNPSEP